MNNDPSKAKRWVLSCLNEKENCEAKKRRSSSSHFKNITNVIDLNSCCLPENVELFQQTGNPAYLVEPCLSAQQTKAQKAILDYIKLLNFATLEQGA